MVKLTDDEKKERQIRNDWSAFSHTLAYEDLMGFIKMEKERWAIMAQGPLDVDTLGSKSEELVQFEPEKFAYLLQRSVGCDIVKMYVESLVEKQEPSA